MRVPGIKTARTVSRWVQARLLGGALILGYHRIAHVPRDGYEVCVSPENFSDHLDILSKHTFPVSLSRLVQHLQDGSLPPKSVAVTFDDGYIDNLYEARPLLEKYEVPATVFVCTGYAGKEFWWDELERLVVTSTADLGALQIRMDESRFHWEPSRLSPEAQGPGEGLRLQFQQALYRYLLPQAIEQRSQTMEVIRSWSGLPHNVLAPVRAMTPAELLQLVDGGLVELGSHTRNHPMLPELSLEGQRDEILSGKRDLESILNKAVDGFSYPNGRATAVAKRIVYEAGFSYACTSLHDVVRPGSDLHELTRFWQKDVDGDKFLQGLKMWMNGS